MTDLILGDQQIKVLPRSIVEFLKNNYSGHLKAVDIISICDPETGNLFSDDCTNVLTLSFHDVDRPKGGYIAFDKEMVNKVIDFLLNRDKDKPLIVHCTAGISRSGAIASFARQLYGIDFELFMKDNPNILPNAWVSSLLNQEMRSRNA